MAVSGVSKKLFIKTYGCQMNVYDSGRMTDVLAPLGYAMTEAVEEADMVILNTCHIREKAAEKVFSELGRLKHLKDARTQKGSETILAVAGCVAQAEGEEIMRRAPYVDMVFGPQTYHRLPEMVAQATRAADKSGRRGVLDIDFPAEAKFDHLPEPTAHEGYAAFLSVQEGCDKFCTFCVVPYTRGAEYSRPVANIVKEAKGLASKGVCEITLIGQNVNAYHGRSAQESILSLGELIAEVADIEGVERIRYTTSHPADVDEALIAAHRDIPKLMPFLHLPVQSGSDRILAAMNRRHSRAEYLETVAALKAARPDLILSSDFIVGFPGENDRDFQDTLDLVRDVRFVQAYSFKYSPRPGTPAATMDYQIDESVKAQRLETLQTQLNDIQIDFNRSCVGKVMPVLLDRIGRDEGQLVGRSPYMQPVHVTAPETLMGRIVDLKITAGYPNSLSGQLVEGEQKDMTRACA